MNNLTQEEKEFLIAYYELDGQRHDMVDFLVEFGFDEKALDKYRKKILKKLSPEERERLQAM